MGIVLLLMKKWHEDLPFGVDTDQFKLLPAAIYYFSDAEIELATHNDRVVLSC
jgi:hypothetical protein